MSDEEFEIPIVRPVGVHTRTEIFGVYGPNILVEFVNWRYTFNGSELYTHMKFGFLNKWKNPFPLN